MSPKGFFVGSHPALDFLNTIAAPHGVPIESIPDGESYVAWLAAASLVEAPDVPALRRKFAVNMLDRVAADARAFREWFRHELEKRDDSQARWPTPRAAAKLNRILAAGSSCPQLELTGKEWALREKPEFTRTPQLLVPVARAVADLAAQADWGLVRRCANPNCTLWFYDQTKAHSRLYCSAAICGNRAKVAAFRERQRRASRGGNHTRS